MPARRAGTFPRRFAATVHVATPPAALFDRLDDPTRLSAHMSTSSWRMVGGGMETVLDEGRGQRPGSRTVLRGRVLGMTLSVESAVVERTPPVRKTWETVGEPRLLVIGRYRMGYEIGSSGTASRVTVFIDYAPPHTVAGRVLCALLGGFYARWCVHEMLAAATTRFSPSPETVT